MTMTKETIKSLLRNGHTLVLEEDAILQERLYVKELVTEGFAKTRPSQSKKMSGALEVTRAD